jgi:hypothetical protein
MQTVGCLMIRYRVAGCSESHTKHENAFCWRDLDIMNVKICDSLTTTGIQMVKYLSTFDRKLNYTTKQTVIKHRRINKSIDSKCPNEKTHLEI